MMRWVSVDRFGTWSGDDGPCWRGLRGGLQVGALRIGPGRPRENGDMEVDIGKRRHYLLNREIFTLLFEVQVLMESIAGSRYRPGSDSPTADGAAAKAIEWHSIGGSRQL